MCLWECFQKRVSGLNKEDNPCRCSWAPSSPLRAWIEQKGRGRGSSLAVLELGHASSALRHQHAGTCIFGPQTPACWDMHLRPSDTSILRSQAFGLRLGFPPFAPWCSGLQTWAESHWLSWFSGLQMTDRGTSQLPFRGEPTPRLHLLFICIYIYMSHFSISLTNPNTPQSYSSHTFSWMLTKHQWGLTQRKWKP